MKGIFPKKNLLMLKHNPKKILLSFLIILIIFALDRISKFYILNLSETGEFVNIYINPFLNLYLIWNTGVGFGLLSLSLLNYCQILN